MGVVAAAAFLGIALGVAALVVSLALLSGFQTHVRGRLASETPHLSITPAGRGAFGAEEGIARKLRALPGAVAVAPVVRGRLWLTLRGQATPVEAVGRADAKGLVLDATQARPLGAFPGDEVTLVSSRSRLSPLGPVPIVASMTVEELAAVSTGRRLPEAVLPLDAARRLFALGEGGATGYEVRLADPAAADAAAGAARAALGGNVTVTTWEEANRALVLALRLERFVLFATVFLIVVVAGLNLAATSAVLAATRAADAAVLAVLGASQKTVASVFRWAGGFVGSAGTLGGAVLGVAVSVVLDRTGAIPLPAQLYALDHVPFRVEAFDVAAVTILSFGWSFLAASVPARSAARRSLPEVLRAA